MCSRSIEEKVHDALHSDRSSLFRLPPLWQRGANYIQTLQAHAKVVSPLSPSLVEADGSPVLHYEQDFTNWGKTVSFTPAVIVQPKTRVGLQNIVKWAKAQQKRVRVCGYHHSWTSLFGENNGVLVSLVSFVVSESYPARHPPYNPSDNEFERIELLQDPPADIDQKYYGLIRVGGGVTNYQFQEWARTHNYTFPSNTVMTEITIAGATAPMCHGAGIRHQTLADLVYAMEFVNVNGEIQIVGQDQLDQLHAAAGSFGLMGVIVSLTLKLAVMSNAVMEPRKDSLELTIPPPAIDSDFFAVQKNCLPAHLTMPEKEDADRKWQEFIRAAKDSYYSEWFWFPGQDRCWINCWTTVPDKPPHCENYPSEKDAWVQEIEEVLANLFLNPTVWKEIGYDRLAKLSGTATMAVLPPNRYGRGEEEGAKICAPLCDALHFRHGIQNMPCIDFEVEIPIPLLASSGELDWEVAREAWWTILCDYYEHPNSPMTLALEMRILGGSDVILSSQRGNVATCSIEVLSHNSVDSKDWNPYITRLFHKLCEIRGGSLRTRIRPHWAKIWQGITWVDKESGKEMDMAVYLKEVAYKEAIVEFKTQLDMLGRDPAVQQSYNNEDCRQLFSNPVMDYMIWDVGSPPPAQFIQREEAPKNRSHPTPTPNEVSQRSSCVLM